MNAVLHGHVSGRDFHLRVHVARRSGTVRVGVTDTRSERLPPRPGVARPVPGAEEGGRGLLLVAHLAARWDWHLRTDGPGKTIWAEYELPGRDHARGCAVATPGRERLRPGVAEHLAALPDVTVLGSDLP
ncbi:ATP-binding protein [Streptomyces sp. QTS52]